MPKQSLDKAVYFTTEFVSNHTNNTQYWHANHGYENYPRDGLFFNPVKSQILIRKLNEKRN